MLYVWQSQSDDVSFLLFNLFGIFFYKCEEQQQIELEER